MKKLITLISTLVIVFVVSAGFASVAFADEDAHVDKIDLRVSEPTLNGLVNPNAFSFFFEPADYGSGLTKAAITWFDSDGSPMVSHEPFEADGIYTVMARGSFSDGYSLDSLTTLLVNGKPADPEKSFVSENKKDFTIFFTFPAVCGHTSTHIEGYVPATTEAPGYTGDTYCDRCHKFMSGGKVIPQLPKPIKSATFTFPEIKAGGSPYGLSSCTYQTDPANIIDITVCQWYRLVDAKRDAWEPLGGETFKEGETYAVEITGRVREGYAGDKNTRIVIDGGNNSRYTYGYITSYRVDVSCQWTVTSGSESGDAPDSGDSGAITVTKIDALIPVPVVGESPSSNVILKSTPEEAVELDYVEWGYWDVDAKRWIRMDSSDIFQEGHKYVVDIYVRFLEGYAGDDYITKFFVNGLAADEKYTIIGSYLTTISYEWASPESVGTNPGTVVPADNEPSIEKPSREKTDDTGKSLAKTSDNNLPLYAVFVCLMLAGAIVLVARRFARR